MGPCEGHPVYVAPPDQLEMSEEDKAEVDRRIKEIILITENQYLCKKEINKESKNMQCECSLWRRDNCGDDCLNRVLYIECGKSCNFESNCSNKRFQNNQYADVEVFKTEWKGVGLRARSYIPKDTFIIEYVGEVIDTRLFEDRAKQYDKDQVQHFYFMALSEDQVVDATCKGNISRFINHSCDPNAETQKWTVNGELRVGFFTTRSIQSGEEVSYDYKYERYGNVAQKCYCGTSRCRGWLGGEPGSDSGSGDAPKTPQGPSGQQTKLLEQSPMGPFEGHPVSVPTISSPVRSVSRQILQSPTVVQTPERRLSREAQLRTPERRSASRKYLLYPIVTEQLPG